MKLHINPSEVSWQLREMGDPADYIYIIWKCKDDDCKTIFTYENMMEMN